MHKTKQNNAIGFGIDDDYKIDISRTKPRM